MRLSQFFMPTLKETPSEAQVASHRLMLRAGMVHQSSAGIYSWLPLGLRVLKRIERIVREEQDAAGCQELLMPTIQPADIWRESGRYEDYGREMLRINDRHDREMLYGPTNEELITDIFRYTIKSYRDLPKLLYHIQWKFRDEVRPRFGVMRGREFLMKDCYSFDLDYASAKKSYNKMFACYLRTFARMGLKAIPMQADTGPIGGELSHEFVILAQTGESDVYCHKDLMNYDVLGLEIDYSSDLEPLVHQWTKHYAATDEKHNPEFFESQVPINSRLIARGIEVGHIFYFGTKYSESMGARVSSSDGLEIPVEMGSYGIGVSRLVGAIIEANHDDAGIVWPETLTPFKVGLLNLKVDDSACTTMCDDLYTSFLNAGIEVLYDDTAARAGAKFASLDLIGIPWQVVIGPRGVKRGLIEVKSRATGKHGDMTADAVVARFAS